MFNDNTQTDPGDFVVQSIIPQPGQTWEVNRPITITFSQAVNFQSISPASISIFRQGTNEAALGTFTLQNQKTVLFQPSCPTSSQPPGLSPNGVSYTINITGSTQPTVTTITNTTGEPLKAGKTQTFVTATATNPNDTFDPALFYDSKPNQAPLVSSATFTTIDNDGTVLETAFDNGATVPTNKFVGPTVFFTLNFDQPLLPSPTNVSTSNISLRFQSGPNYLAIPASVELVENCTASGAKVRITPLGLLPAGRRLRIVIGQNFSDIKGETSPFPTNVPINPANEPITNAAASPADFDAIVEQFNNSVNFDADSGFVEPAADWGNGSLQASFNFSGQPTNLDLIVNNGQVLVIDTTASTLTLTDPNSNPTTASFANGNIFLRRLIVNAGGTIQGQGPNPLRFFVNETVTVALNGLITVDGVPAPDVATLLTACQFPQAGGGGVCGGGDGGLGNPVTSQSCAQGGAGSGSFNVLNGGGVGGESGLITLTTGGAQCNEVEDRHPAGGGGGSYMTLGERGRDGTDGNYAGVGSCSVPTGKSAVNPNTFPQGGPPGTRPFPNQSIADDFFGNMILKSGTISSSSLQGGFTQIVTTQPIFAATDQLRFAALFRALPSQSWEDGTANCTNSAADITLCVRSRVQVRRIRSGGFINSTTVQLDLPALTGPNLVAPTFGDVVVVYGGGNIVKGEISTPLGGQGGGGGGNAITSTTFPNPLVCTQDRKGAGGGGGGGILEIRALGVVTILGTLSASGGRGGAGENSIGLDRIGGGGGGGSGGTIIVESSSSATPALILNNGGQSGTVRARGGSRGFGAYNSPNSPTLTPVQVNGIGHGGRGGKGLVQLHVSSPDRIQFAAQQPANSNFDPNPLVLSTSFGPISNARSTWFDTGAGLAVGLPTYQFGGICPPSQPACGPTGRIITDASGNVDTANPVIAGDTLLVSATNLTANTITLPFAQVNTATNQKAAEPQTLKLDLVRIGGNVGSIIGVARPDSNTIVLTTDNNSTSNPTALNAGVNVGNNASWSIVSRFFAVSRIDPVSGIETPNFIQPDTLANGNRVQIQFQGANADINGQVDLSTIVPNPAIDPAGTSDLTQLAGRRFVRFTTTFNISTNGPVNPSSFRPRVDFLKLPFRFN